MADLPVVAAEVQAGVLVGDQFERGIANEAITAGQSLYRTTDMKLGLADANDVSSGRPKAVIVGIATCNAAEGQMVTYQTKGTITLGATAAMTVGDIIVATATAGGLAASADIVTGWAVSIAGVASSTSDLDIDFNNSAIIAA